MGEPLQENPGIDPEHDTAERLRRLTEQADPVPSEVIEAARHAFDLRRPNTELLHLVDDTADADRGAPSRTLAFKGESCSLDVTVVAIGDRRRLRGHVEPGRPRSVEATTGDATVPAAGAGDGDFEIDGLASGPVRIHFDYGTSDGEHHAETDWVDV